MTIKFKNPPINELVVGVYFNTPLLALRAEHIGLFWHTIRGEFPLVQQQGPIVSQTGGFAEMASSPEEVYPLPRFWFVTADETMLVQVQRTAFLLNWRKRDQEYPHFDKVKQDFDRLYAVFTEFLRTTVRQEFAIETAELTYINLIEAGGYWQEVNDIATVIPGFRTPEIGVGGAVLTGVTQTTAWKLAEDLNLSLKIQNAQLRANQRPALLVELSAKGRLGAAAKVEADAWFRRAHDATGQAFRGLTSREIQARIWQPVEERA